MITNVFFLVFQSTHPHGVRREDATPTTMNWQSFNPRTLTGCDRKKIPGPSKQRSFNPRTLTGCDSTGHYQQCRRDVSIHAPSRGATEVWLQMAQRKIVSIHAPSQGATLQKRAWEYISTTFQSTHPHGVRPFRHGRDRHRHTCFNPRTLTGCDCIGCGLMCIFMVFQSTHPHGVRRLTTIGGRNGQGVSIHAPSRGATIRHL